MDAKINLRTQFEEKIIPLIRTTPKHLSVYFNKKCAPVNHCEKCRMSYLVKEKGLTEENISIYVRFIRIWGGSHFEYCIGVDSDGYTLCYGREVIPLITQIHKEIFSQISTVAYTLRNSEDKSLRFEEMYQTTKSKTIKYWNIFDNGILALNSAYKKTEFEDSKDILSISLHKSNIVFLHGHQLKSFSRGERLEQKYPTKYPDKSIDFISMGHFHKLGVFSIDKFGGLITMTGSSLYPDIYFPEMISHIGSCVMKIDRQTYETSFIIKRNLIDNNEMEETKKKNKDYPMTFNEKIDVFRKLCKDSWCILPGNHDSFDEIYFKNHIDIRNLNLHLLNESGILGNGDYIDFVSSELEDGKKHIFKILNEENFESISIIRKKQ